MNVDVKNTTSPTNRQNEFVRNNFLGHQAYYRSKVAGTDRDRNMTPLKHRQIYHANSIHAIGTVQDIECHAPPPNISPFYAALKRK